MITLQRTIAATRAWACLDCGKCTGVCPVSRHDGRFSPRRTVADALLGKNALVSQRLWACLTCGRCSPVCPANVHYTTLVRDLRIEAHAVGERGPCTHGDVIHGWMRMMAVGRSTGLTTREWVQDRLGWLDDGLRTSLSSDTLFFVGCAPYYDVLFRDSLGIEGVQVPRASVRLLNHLGIEPVVLPDEVCCGHDLLWEGDVATFRRLAERNAALIRETGVRRVVTGCAECARTLRVDYPQFVGPLGVEVLHLAELIADCKLQIADCTLQRVTYHDPCRLGRHLGVYDPPRRALEAAGYQVVEMAHSGPTAVCCGTSGWTDCGAANKGIQVARLREAVATGAEVLVTACPKCQIHLKCALADKEVGAEIGIAVRDLGTMVAAQINEQ